MSPEERPNSAQARTDQQLRVLIDALRGGTLAISSKDPLAIRARDSIDHVERLLLLMLQRDRNDRRRGRMDERGKILRALQKKNEELLALREREEQESTPESDREPPV